ncbi:glycoside hydrolase family 2 protein [Coniophora puteana RWD-64-598 SS2]|uniref:Beta-mannosidase B n=1 Tax=Coniophora puteana (strain RWD-64-598) TaxID=741705 RepID=A0A5M3MSB5_CONPW|nr:glycoside hydrolase family 2 protein [Coniophora puteana RWD-64-598 SS2]EIW82049.1 glycoside hydrolase family 2 protein [Coniophora puteana RWD-64-598 SS2]
MATLRTLTEGWAFTQVGGGKGTKDGEWLEVAHAPTSVHVELLKVQRIPDPFLGLNEWEVQWVGETEWAFKNSFKVTEEELSASNVDLVFEGLDTYATVKLNGQNILNTENQFIEYRAAAKQHLKAGTNELVITFASAFKKGRELEKANGKLHLWNGDSSRLHVRKAQYNYGWDWGPVLMTAGPWRPIHLHAYNVRIVDLDVRSKVSESLEVNTTVDIKLSEKITSTATIEIKNASGQVVAAANEVKIAGGSARGEFKFAPGAIDLWYPVGYGKQPMYTVNTKVYNSEGKLLDSSLDKVSFRRVQVVQEPLADQEGKTFLFEVNNIRIFCGGSNWIPADSFLTTITPDRYRAWIQLLVDGNQNMIRVWGGGVFEHQSFYDACDELGVLVWQDFMFGCGQYPAYDSFLKLVEAEAEHNVKRLRHHPSLVIFAGNNEDYQIAESLNIVDYADETSDFRVTKFPARHIYERTLPEIVGRLSDVFYHRSSPYSAPGVKTTDKTLGDLHQWNVWHGTQEPWHNWDILAGRFVSEFGMEGFPDIRTVDYWLAGNKSERYPQSRTNNSHNKADGFERRLELYLVENFKHAFDMESYVYYTQVMQAETLSAAYRLWRRNWKGRGREYTAGALVWQINDCWPTTSWAIVDYFLRPKPAYFAIARELKPYTVGAARKEVKTFASDLSAADFTVESTLAVWGSNFTLAEKKVTLELTAFDLHSDWTESWTKEVTLAPNMSAELWSGRVPGTEVRTKLSDVPRTVIVSTRLLGDDGTVLARYANWPEPYKFVDFPPVPQLGLSVLVGADGESVTLDTRRPVKGIVLDAEGEGPDVRWSDQAIDLVPGDRQIVTAKGLTGRKVSVRFLGDGSA